MSIVAVTSGVACLGPDRGGQTCLALRDEWLGPPGPHDRDAALRELARRYLRGFGPATEVDFAGWSGLGLSDVRSALGAIAHELTEVRIGDQRAWRLRGAARRPGRRIVRLLPAFDTYLMGYRERDFIAAPERWSRIAPGGGLLHPVVLVDGSAAGTWRSKRSGRGIRVEIEPFAELDPLTIGALEAEVADVGRFEGAGATLDAS